MASTYQKMNFQIVTTYISTPKLPLLSVQRTHASLTANFTPTLTLTPPKRSTSRNNSHRDKFIGRSETHVKQQLSSKRPLMRLQQRIQTTSAQLNNQKYKESLNKGRSPPNGSMSLRILSRYTADIGFISTAIDLRSGVRRVNPYGQR